MFKIAENVCLSRRRSSWRRGKIESPSDFQVIEEIVPGPSRERDELIGIEDALASMPEQQRRAILLREWQGLSYREVAAELEVSQSAVETLIFRARRSLAQGLEQPELGQALETQELPACRSHGRPRDDRRGVEDLAHGQRRREGDRRRRGRHRCGRNRRDRGAEAGAARAGQGSRCRGACRACSRQAGQLLAGVGTSPDCAAARLREAGARRSGARRGRCSARREDGPARTGRSDGRAAHAGDDADRGRVPQAHRRGPEGEGQKDEGQGKAAAPGQQDKGSPAPAEPQPVAAAPQETRRGGNSRGEGSSKKETPVLQAPSPISVSQAKPEHGNGHAKRKLTVAPVPEPAVATAPTPVADAAEPAAAAEVVAAADAEASAVAEDSAGGKRNGKLK